MCADACAAFRAKGKVDRVVFQLLLEGARRMSWEGRVIAWAERGIIR